MTLIDRIKLIEERLDALENKDPLRGLVDSLEGIRLEIKMLNFKEIDAKGKKE